MSKIEIDGSYGESGGQIVRTSLALSAVTGKACRLINIRKGRLKPGLQIQHLEAVKSMAVLCNARVKGDELHSTEVDFIPEEIKSRKIHISILTAGSVGLVLQPLMIASTVADKEITIEVNGGATNAKWAAPTNYIKNVLLPILKKSGYRGNMEIHRYGYYPAGGANVVFHVEPAKIKPLNLVEQGKILNVTGISHAEHSLSRAHVAERQAKTAQDILKKEKIDVSIEVKYINSACPGSAIDMWMESENSIIGSSGLGEKGKIAEDVGKDAANMILEQKRSGAPVDEYMADQLIPYIGLAGSGKLRVSRITDHCRTNIWATEKFLPVKFFIDEKNNIIKCAKTKN